MTIDGKMLQQKESDCKQNNSGEDFLLGDDLLTELGDVLKQLQLGGDSNQVKMIAQDDNSVQKGSSPEKEVDHLVRRLEELDQLNRDKSIAES